MISPVEEFFSQFNQINYQPGDLLLTATETPDGVYFLKQGVIRQYVDSVNGIELTIHLYVPGSHFPMTWVMTDLPNRYNFQALTKVQLYKAPKTEVVKYFKSHPEFLWQFSQRIVSGLEGLSQRVEMLVVSKAYNRVAAALLFFAKHLGETIPSGIELAHPFTHREIAAMAGLTRERTSIELEKLTSQQIIKVIKHRIVILDEKQLRVIAKANL